jgi:predicted HicB family RNase H-like nuclease
VLINRNPSNIYLFNYKYLYRKLQYLYRQKSIYYDYYKKEVIEYKNKIFGDSLEFYQLLQAFTLFLKKSSQIDTENYTDDELFIQFSYFMDILLLEYVLNEVRINDFNKKRIIDNSFEKVFNIIKNRNEFDNMVLLFYKDIYIMLLKLVSCDQLDLKDKNEKAFYIYDDYLNNSFERTLDIFKRKEFKLENFMDELYKEFSINLDNIIENCELKLERLQNNFSNYFTKTVIDTDVDKDRNLNLELKINAFKNGEHFFSFFEYLHIDIVNIKESKKEVFPLLIISLRNALIRSCSIEIIKTGNEFKKVKRFLEKFIKNPENLMLDRIEAYVFLILLTNRDLRFKNLDIVFLSQYLSLSCSHTIRFVKTNVFLESGVENINEISVNYDAIKKYYYLLNKTYFDDNINEIFTDLYNNETDSKDFNLELREDLKELLKY